MESPVDCGDTRVDSDVEASRKRIHGAGRYSAAEADARPGEKIAGEGFRRRERSAKEKKHQMSLGTVIGVFTRGLRRRPAHVMPKC